ncbi:MAG: hypothetical protein KAJ45_02680 [Desulfobulbaceae bacterium]|nr:hypothetical protein [Desulfobulbaceae bacterium]
MANQGLNLINVQMLNTYMPSKVDAPTKTTQASDSNPPSDPAYNVEISAEARKIEMQYDRDQETVTSEYTQKKESLETEYNRKQQTALAEYKMAQQNIEAEHNRNRLMLQKRL